MEAPSEDKIKQMLANTKKSIEDRKKKLNIGLTGAGETEYTQLYTLHKGGYYPKWVPTIVSTDSG